MENTATAVAESSPAVEVEQQVFEAPTEPKAYQNWLKTGEMPEKAKPSGESAPPKSKEESTPSETGEESAPPPENKQQERRAKSDSATRLQELLDDLKRAGLSPAELKTFKREAQRAEPPAAKPAEAAPPQGSEAPKKPKQSDFQTFEEYEEARDKWVEETADYRAKQAVEADRRQRAEEARTKELGAKLSDAKARYGDEAQSIIGGAVQAITGDQAIHPYVKQMLDDSPVLVDAMYVLGSNAEELQAFIDLARSNPSAAVRKLVVIEGLVEQELAKSGKSEPEAPRSESGQFQKPPAKEKPPAPPPATELNTRGSTPPDPIEAAVRNNDFRAFEAEERRRDLAKRRGA